MAPGKKQLIYCEILFDERDHVNVTSTSQANRVECLKFGHPLSKVRNFNCQIKILIIARKKIILQIL